MRLHHTDDILVSAEDIRLRVHELVEEMAHACQSENLTFIGILRGSFMFLADLVRQLDELDIHPRIDFMTLSSRGSGVESTGEVIIRKDITVDVSGSDVIVVDDILDTGRTLSFAVAHLKQRGAARIYSCMLLDKPSRREVAIEADFVGFTIEDTFVVGYGLDYDSHYRELPYIAEVTFLDEDDERSAP